MENLPKQEKPTVGLAAQIRLVRIRESEDAEFEVIDPLTIAPVVRELGEGDQSLENTNV